MKRIIWHGVAMALIAFGVITGYLFFVPVGILLEVVWGIYVMWLSDEWSGRDVVELHDPRDKRALDENEQPKQHGGVSRIPMPQGFGVLEPCSSLRVAEGHASATGGSKAPARQGASMACALQRSIPSCNMSLADVPKQHD